MRAHARRAQGGAQHLLLDPPHLHPQLRPLEEGGRGRAPPGGGQNQGREGQEARQILSVGRIPAFSSGRRNANILQTTNIAHNVW